MNRAGRTRDALVPHRGSVLLENLVAMALLGLLFVSVLGLLATGSLAAQMAKELSLSEQLAAQKLEEVTAECLRLRGVDRRALDPVWFPGYEWRADVATVAPALHQVTVTVWWWRHGQERRVSVTTLVRRRDE